MELKNLYTFRTVAEELSFTNAAYKLNYSQSSVSDHIKALENELNILLFERIGKHVILTEAGHRFLAEAEKIINQLEEIKEIVSGSEIPSGKLTIGAHESQLTYRLINILREFRSNYPNVQLVFRPLISDESIKVLLKQGVLDAAFLLGFPHTNPSEIIVEPLVEEQILILSSVDHPLTRLAEITPGDFNNQTILTTEQGCSYRQMFEHLLNNNNVHTGIKIEFSSIEAIKQCVIAGLGIAVLPKITVAKEISQHLIAVLPCEQLNYSILTQLAWHKDKWISPSLKAFLEIARNIKN
ncbi:MAG: LysR family transcriptional regulator [Bacillota bacterium]